MVQPFLAKFSSKQIYKGYKQDILLLVFQMLFSFSCFPHKLFVHINEKVLFQHVVFLLLI